MISAYDKGLEAAFCKLKEKAVKELDRLGGWDALVVYVARYDHAVGLFGIYIVDYLV